MTTENKRIARQLTQSKIRVLCVKRPRATRSRLVPCPNVGQASTNRNLRLYIGGVVFLVF